MVRPMRRIRQQLDAAECKAILERGTSGVLALSGDDGYPYAVPLSYLYTEGRIIFHGAKEGYKLDCMRRCPKASFCVVDKDEIIPEKYTTHFRSVICRGTMRIVGDRDEIVRLCTALGERFRPGHPEDSRKAADDAISRLCIFVLDVEDMTGKEAIELTRRREENA